MVKNKAVLKAASNARFARNNDGRKGSYKRRASKLARLAGRLETKETL